METSRGINRRLHERLAFVDYSSLYSSCLYTCSSHGRRVLPLCFQLSLVFAKKEMKQTKSGFRVSLPPSFSLSLSLSWGFPLQCFKEWPVSSLITRHVIISVVDCEALDPLPPPRLPRNNLRRFSKDSQANLSYTNNKKSQFLPDSMKEEKGHQTPQWISSISQSLTWCIQIVGGKSRGDF